MSQLFDTDAEDAVLGFCLVFPKAIPAALERGLAPRHFFGLTNQRIWAELARRHDAEEPIDPHLVEVALEVPAGSVDILAASGYVNAERLHAYAERIVELALWRDRQHEAAAMQVACEAQDEVAYASCESALQRTHRSDEHTYSPEQLADQLFAMMENTEETFPWPFTRLNDLTQGGMRRGQLTLIAGWSVARQERVPRPGARGGRAEGSRSTCSSTR
jgi:replicative DNA helicase